MKKIIWAPESIITKWKVWFLNDVSKFMNPSCMTIEDLGREFSDHKGNRWKLLGSLDSKEVGCLNLETGKVWTWDRWKVSEILRPEEHAYLKSIFKKDKIVKRGLRPEGYDPIVHKELQFEAQKKAAELAKLNDSGEESIASFAPAGATMA